MPDSTIIRRALESLTIVVLAVVIVPSACRPGEPVAPSAVQEARKRQAEAEPEGARAPEAVEGSEGEAGPHADRPGEQTRAMELGWTRRAPVPSRRTEVSATSDGRYVYLAGGFGAPTDRLAMVARPEDAAAPREVLRYDPEADSWDVLTELPEGVHHAAFVHHEGRLYVLGGFRETTFEPTGDVRIFCLEMRQWAEGACMPTPRGGMGFALHEGRIHLIGGNATGAAAIEGQQGVRMAEDRSVNVHEAYEPASDRWLRLEPMRVPRNHLGAASIGGRIHVVAGRVDGDFELTAHEIFDPAARTWTDGPPLPTGRSGVGVLAHMGHVYVFGGETFADPPRTFNSAERFDPESMEWEVLPPMPTARHGLGAAAVGDAIYTVSGGPEPAVAFGDANERLLVPRPLARSD